MQRRAGPSQFKAAVRLQEWLLTVKTSTTLATAATVASVPAVGPRIALSLAGAATLTSAGGVAMALGPSQAALLAWLAIEGPTARFRLVTLLWPDSDLGAARNSLRQRLFRLHKLAGGEVVVGGNTLALAATVTHDLATAHQLLAALPNNFSGELALWLETQRAARRDEQAQALVALANSAEREGDLAKALAHGKDVLALLPLSEAAHRRLMHLHYLQGERAAALLAFDDCERVLKDEIGARPCAETLALLRSIEQSAGAAAGPLALLRMPAAMLRPPRRIGRNLAWQALRAVRDGAQVLLLSGEAGMGKSRLLSDLLADPALGAKGSPGPVLLVSARPGDAAVPYATLVRLLRLLLAWPSLAPASATRSALAHLLPELGEPAPPPREGDAARVAHAVLAWLDQAQRDGLRALLVDDLHFADDASTVLLPQLIGHGRWGCVLAMRRAEISATAQAVVSALEADAQVASLALAPLTAQEVAELLDSLGVAGIGGPTQAQALNRHTGGNPLYVLETVKAAVMQPLVGRALVPAGDPGSAARAWPTAATVQRLIQQRLARLSQRAVQVSRCAAVAGQDCTADLVAHVLACKPLDLADAWAELEAAQVLNRNGFVHDLIADAALASVPHAVAQPLHADVAQWLERGNGESARIANHWLAAEQPLRAAPHLMAAADRAHDAWRMAEAAVLAEQAGRIWLDAGQHAAAFDAFFAAGDFGTEADDFGHLERLRDFMAPLVSNDGQRAMLALVEAAIALMAKRFDPLRELVQAALPCAQRAALPEIEAELLWDLVVMHWLQREVTDALRLAERALALLNKSATPPRATRLRDTRHKLIHAMGLMNSALGRYDQGALHLHETRRELLQRNDDRSLVQVETALAAMAADQGDWATARNWSESAKARLVFDEAQLVAKLTVLEEHARIVGVEGDLGTVLALVEQMAVVLEGVNTALAMGRFATAQTRQALFWFGLGRHDLALRGLKQLRQRTDLLAIERMRVEAAFLALGEPGDAALVLTELVALDDFAARVNTLCRARPGLPADQALTLLSMCQSTARDSGAHGLWLELQVHRVAALQALGRRDEAAQAAVAAWQRFEAGVRCSIWLPDMAAWLCPALLASHADLAQVIALRASAWMQAAASTLPAQWRSNYLTRAPALSALLALPPSPSTASG
jgi:DNA-binding SARP family transcriptional activator